MSRTCIFCNQNPDSLTKEHVYPDWLSEKFGANSPGYSKLEGTVDRTWPQQVFQQQVKVVCGACNSGWMSTLEGQVKDKLGPMILEGRPTKLSREDQEAISFWAIKTLLVLQYVLPEGSRIIPASDYSNLYKLQKALPNYVVHLGFRAEFPRDDGSMIATHQVEQIKTISVHRSAHKNVEKQQRAGGKAYGSSLVIGHVAFHIVGHNLEGVSLNIPAIENFEVPIAPYSHTFTWPATLPIEFMGGIEAYRAVFNPPLQPEQQR